MIGFQSLPPNSHPWGQWIERRLRAVETTARNLDTLTRGINARLGSNVAAIDNANKTIEFLSNQTVSNEGVPAGTTLIVLNPVVTTPITWIPFNPEPDAQVQVTTSSTGKISYQAGGYIWINTIFYATGTGFIGVEILDATNTVVKAPQNGDGNMTSFSGDGGIILNANSGQLHELQLSPNTTYTLRCRRGYSAQTGGSGAYVQLAFQGTAITVTKLGI